MPLRPAAAGGRSDRGPGREDDADAADDGKSRWTRAGTACTAVFGAILLSSIAIIAWDRMSSDAPVTAARVPAVSVPATGTVPPPVRSRGSASAGSPIPMQVTWLQVGLGALPFSAAAGPSRIRGGVPSGFAHAPAGAVQAAIQILGRLSWSAQTPTSMQAVVAASTTPSAQAQVILTYGPPTDPSVIPQVAGFQVVAYNSMQAVVNLALRFNGALRVSPATLQWVGSDGGVGDWKLAGAPGPLGQTSWAGVEDLTGYILFSGQPTKAGD
jgi:hypothetical protein